MSSALLWHVKPIVALAGNGPQLGTRPDGTPIYEGTPVHVVFFVIGCVAGFVIYPTLVFLLLYLLSILKKGITKVTLFLLVVVLFCAACSRPEINTDSDRPVHEPSPPPKPTVSPTPLIPNLQAELLDNRNKMTTSPIGNFDFKNYTYELPRGWQNPDGTAEITLTNGRIPPIQGRVTNEEMTDEEKLSVRQQRRIGMSYVTTKFIDVTGDGQDEAIVILKVETAGSAIPQLVYVFTWKDGKPELLWPFRTGDRADGGLKDIRVENGLLVVELYGQDRFLLGQTETAKITGDEEQLCCPTFWTRSFYKWNGKSFLMQGKRLTFSFANRSAPPQENLGEKVNAPPKGKK